MYRIHEGSGKIGGFLKSNLHFLETSGKYRKVDKKSEKYGIRLEFGGVSVK